MANSYLQSALGELRSAGAKGLPSEETVEAAAAGAIWKGTKQNGDSWELIKNSEDSFNCMC